MIIFFKIFLIFSCFTAAIYAKQKQKCGQTPIPPNIDDENIIGGNFAKKYSWPWQISLCTTDDEKNCYFGCSDTIIGEKWIITAGHCVGSKAQNVRIITGVYDERMRNESGEVVHKIKAIHLHPLFNISIITYDIALLELVQPIKFDNHTQPICLPFQDSTTVIEPNTAWTTGWGMKKPDKGDLSRKLRQVNLPFVNSKTCEKEYRDDDVKFVEKVMICAGRAGKADCHGDSGGPLVAKNKNDSAWFQYGIVSWAKGCALKGFPGVFSRVTAYCDFIEATTKGASLQFATKIVCLSFIKKEFF